MRAVNLFIYLFLFFCVLFFVDLSNAAAVRSSVPTTPYRFISNVVVVADANTLNYYFFNADTYELIRVVPSQIAQLQLLGLFTLSKLTFSPPDGRVYTLSTSIVSSIILPTTQIYAFDILTQTQLLASYPTGLLTGLASAYYDTENPHIYATILNTAFLGYDAKTFKLDYVYPGILLDVEGIAINNDDKVLAVTLGTPGQIGLYNLTNGVSKIYTGYSPVEPTLLTSAYQLCWHNRTSSYHVIGVNSLFSVSAARGHTPTVNAATTIGDLPKLNNDAEKSSITCGYDLRTNKNYVYFVNQGTLTSWLDNYDPGYIHKYEIVGNTYQKVTSFGHGIIKNPSGIAFIAATEVITIPFTPSTQAQVVLNDTSPNFSITGNDTYTVGNQTFVVIRDTVPSFGPFIVIDSTGKQVTSFPFPSSWTKLQQQNDTSYYFGYLALLPNTLQMYALLTYAYDTENILKAAVPQENGVYEYDLPAGTLKFSISLQGNTSQEVFNGDKTLRMQWSACFAHRSPASNFTTNYTLDDSNPAFYVYSFTAQDNSLLRINVPTAGLIEGLNVTNVTHTATASLLFDELTGDADGVQMCFNFTFPYFQTALAYDPDLSALGPTQNNGDNDIEGDGSGDGGNRDWVVAAVVVPVVVGTVGLAVVATIVVLVVFFVVKHLSSGVSGGLGAVEL